MHTKILSETDGKRTLWEAKHKWEDNIKMDLSETKCVDVKLIQLAQNRVQWRAFVKAAMNLHVP
jgi:hypothetical protein